LEPIDHWSQSIRGGAKQRRPTTISERVDLPKTASAAAAPLPPAALSRQLRYRNRTLAAMLACVAASGFAIVLALALLLHYAEAHHLLANL
jgi:hypothetical protein